jgi:hypothetical protein
MSLDVHSTVGSILLTSFEIRDLVLALDEQLLAFLPTHSYRAYAV